MTDKNIVDKTADAIKGSVDEARDSINETRHRSAAEAEKAKRETEDLTSSDKLKSLTKEAQERAQAEIDAAKRKARAKQ